MKRYADDSKMKVHHLIMVLTQLISVENHPLLLRDVVTLPRPPDRSLYYEWWSKAIVEGLHLRGIANNFNNCYMNVVIQALLAIPLFRRFILQQQERMLLE